MGSQEISPAAQKEVEKANEKVMQGINTLTEQKQQIMEMIDMIDGATSGKSNNQQEKEKGSTQSQIEDEKQQKFGKDEIGVMSRNQQELENSMYAQGVGQAQ